MTTYQSQSTRVRQLFSTLAAATASNPVLLEGEKWSEKSATTGRFTGRTKTGDGVVTGTAPNQTIEGTAFNALPFDPTSGGGDPAGTADAAIAAHVAAADPHPTYTTVQEAAAAAPVQSVAMSPPAGWSSSSANTGGSVTLTLALPAGYSLPSNASQTTWDTAYTERLRWDGGSTGLNATTGRATLGLGTAATTAATDYATAAQGTDSREWSAPTVDQPTAEAGVSTTRVAYNPLRVFQAIAAWWAASPFKTKLDGIASGATANATDAQLRDRSTHTGTQAVDTITGLGTGVAGALAINVGTAGAPVILGGAMDTPSSLTLTNATGLPFGAGISGKPTTLAGYGITDAAASGAIGSSGLTQTAGILGAASAGAPQVYTPLGLAFGGSNLATLADIVIPLSDETSALTASSSVARVTIPYWPRATTLTDPWIWAVAAAPTGAALQFDIQVNGSSIYLPASGGTYPTIAASSTNSTSSAGAFTTAFAAAPTIAVGSSVSFFVRQIGSTIAGAGLKVIAQTRRAG